MKNELSTIDHQDLNHVTGGKSAPTTASGNSGAGNDPLLSSLQDIQSSLKDLGKNTNNGLFSGSNAMLFMTMALAFGRRSEVTVYGNGRQHGYSWRAW